MSGFSLNKDKKWRQSNSSDIYGNLSASWGIDLESNEGKIRPSPSLSTAVINSSTQTTFISYPAAMIYTNADGAYKNWIVSQAQKVFKDANGNLSFTQDSITGTPTDPEYDMAVFTQTTGNDNLVVSGSTDLAKLCINVNGGTWITSWWTGATFLNQAALSSTDPHPISSFLSQYGAYLVIGDGNKVHTVDTSLTSAGVRNTRVQLDTQYQVIWIRSTDTRVFIGTRNKNNRRATIYEYDIINEVLRGYEISGNISLAAAVADNLVYSIDNLGIIYKYNGNGFSKVGFLPIYYLMRNIPDLVWTDSNTPQHMVHHSGMQVIDGMLHILLNNTMNPTGMWEKFPSGVWVLNEDTGNLYCKFRVSNLQTGEKGSARIGNVGFIAPYNSSSLGSAPNSFFVGYSANLGDASNPKVFVTRPTLNSSPYATFITPKVYSANIMENWENCVGIIRQFENISNTVVMKYRNIQRLKAFFDIANNQPTAGGSITFTSTTTFTATDSSFGFAKVGDEIMVVRGTASGSTAHITAISLVAGTYTITIDEPFTLAGDNTAYALVQDWQKLGVFSGSQTTASYNEFHIPSNIPTSTWIQFKAELRGTPYSPEVDDFIIQSSPSYPK